MLSRLMNPPLHSIEAVARRTGLSAHVIRVWEKRYRAVEPVRTPSNRRQYSEENIARLILLRDLARSGQSIGYVAKLPTEQLRQLAATVPSPGGRPSAAPGSGGESVSTHAWVEGGFAAIRALDAAALEDVLKRAEVALGLQGMLQRVAAPFAQRLGDAWRDGSITAAHEHFASAILRTHLAQIARGFSGSGHGPALVVATPQGQLHELGALLAAAFGSSLGWRVTYLGASLPAAEIAGAAIQNRARAVALSLVYPDDDPHLEAELTRLRELLPPEVALVAGGRAVAAYRPVLERIGAFRPNELAELGGVLDGLRQTRAPAT
jgi:MerR family transcriptional regulator, light-induced transcriptional regulator